ncbi:nickel pincer cofactor biosynthesis protein LarC [Synechococcus sp. CS-1324]|uniref:nickel pincer cofactor biosynthesis protein LarC n=1 Tax=unclassified Synechococcus TaxID=2626047 RepID=UPI000DAFB6D7|nr:MULTISPECIES: nickel pincer cofactor biosynthesis protein LarC [unclassified Synechococcus]MCT0214022.1 nickel pincer cofactor biosynthesis protein LarC [Synechococcus sp. CS-1326]MCT0230088.1 nickel pincer cofactor biosynthesis protein LarC [Synechococcus sp. CS-1324]MCT0233598.1 nickel pincer cofactor biosynthesis protein LarC [Synechococcus sp. CS-1327]PZV05196.1 MAG: nickel pincer cofactor biosynthesis protein LarC [Cyanobium sp.]
MTLAYLDCPTGVAGDMVLAALFDLGLPASTVEAPLAALGLSGAYRLRIEEASSGGLRGRRLSVDLLEPQLEHRRWLELRGQIDSSAIEPPLRQKVLEVFGLLAEAEGAVHGHPPERVHFHEVGAVDALVDVVGVCAGLLHFQVDRLICAPPPAGHGVVATAHGLLPLPAPAVLELARRHRVPLAGGDGRPAGELTTPTGMALIAAWVDGFGPAPAMVPSAVGIGLGHRQLDRPNLLRLWLAAEAMEPEGAELVPAARPILETVLLQQAQIDDATAEDLAFLVEELRAAEALEVYSQAVQMKKGRCGVLLTVVAQPERAAALRAIWWRHGSSLGVREHLEQRWCLPRLQRQVSTAWGEVRIKWVTLPDGSHRSKPEHDDLASLARAHGLSLQEVREAALRALAGDNPDPSSDAAR